ncbi:hypothetical protein GCM10010988_07690 [Cnuibacter physcomitrellae]|uniref:Uncharacterized protein n=1 Tax=Cnuibacter physcomitrellae TaxID=1619308 RepID=A0A1X9LKB9_9MICO|nr:hypothetical protein [Cnuibacter physcomitrellae]ARJ05656.1 hypothetical protein B5808_10800 [Cnuibacter physcomitrellae]GGI36186.1 hypothetical protein GCM10010988_07690 [Cnuibacter physcomitrellae]
MASGLDRTVDRLLSVQRPAVLAHLRGIRRLHPDADPARLITILERRYLAAVTSGGAAVGASSMLPFVGTGTALALSGAETAGFLETTALFAQSVTEVHGIAVSDRDRARALVMTLMMGKAGSDLLRQIAGQATGTGVTRNAYWGQVVTSSLPSMVVGPIADQLKRVFVKRFAVGQGANVVGRLVPFGVGAAIGGVGNLVLGRTVVQSSRSAFGPAPLWFTSDLEITPREAKAPRERGRLDPRRMLPSGRRKDLPALEELDRVPDIRI